MAILFINTLKINCNNRQRFGILYKRSGNSCFVRNEAGITLTEMLVVMVILAILLGMAVLSWSLIRQERIRSLTKDLVVDLQRARSDAMLLGTTSTVHGTGIRFGATWSSRFTFQDTDNDYQYTSDLEESNVETRGFNFATIHILIGGVLVPPQLASPNDIVLFDHFGFPRQGDWSLINDRTIVISHASLATYQRCIRIQTGRIREGMWNAATSTCSDQ